MTAPRAAGLRSLHRRIFATLLLAALACAAPPVARAHDFAQMAADADTLRLSLDDAVQRAMTQSEEMRAANAGLSVASGKVKEALSVALPQVNGTLTYNRKFASIFQAAGPDTGALADLFKSSPFGSQHTWTADLTASQLIWSGGRVGAGLAAARAYRKSVRAGLDQTAADLSVEVQRAYLEAAYAQRVVAISQSGLDQARAHLAQVTLYHKQGSRSDYDLIRAQVDAANQAPPVVAAKNSSELAMLELKRLANIPIAKPLVLTTELAFGDSLVPVADEGGDDPAARAALAQADADVEGRRQLLRVERAARWPQLSASGTLSQQAFPHTERPKLDEFHRNLDASIKLEFPLFLGGKTFGSVERAGAELRQAEAQRDRTREQVAIEAARARQEVRRTLADLVARRGTAQLAGRAQYLAEVRYKNGLATQLEVTDARLQYQTAEINEVQAIKDYRLALIELERSLGRRVPVTRRSLDQISSLMNSEQKP